MDLGLPGINTAQHTAKSGVLDTSKLKQLGRDGDEAAAAREMEKLFASMLVSELRKALPEGFFGKDAGHDTYGAWFDEHVGASLADSGALNLAGQIKASMARPDATPADAVPTEDGR